MEYIEYDNFFDSFGDDPKSKVFQVFPKVFDDSRGSFTEVLKDFGKWPTDNIPLWFTNLSWIRQINRSTSAPFVCRGMHAQKGAFCQSKLVECISGHIHDIIVDARPNSKTYGWTKSYCLDSLTANKLYVPVGFLHGFFSDNVMPNGTYINTNIFQYYIGGGTYSHENEFSVSMTDILEMLRKSDDSKWIPENKDILFSDKDKNGLPAEKWFADTMNEYKSSGKLWYK